MTTTAQLAARNKQRHSFTLNRHRTPYVEYPVRQPATVSWWLSEPTREGFTAAAERERARMSTSPFSTVSRNTAQD